MFIIVTIQLMSVNGERQKKKDDDALCLTASILCVQNVSLEISKTAKNVSVMVSEIEISLVNIIRSNLFLIICCSILAEKRNP